MVKLCGSLCFLTLNVYLVIYPVPFSFYLHFSSFLPPDGMGVIGLFTYSVRIL